MEAEKAAATQLLEEYYQIDPPQRLLLPTQRVKSQWQADNKRGFFLGIIQEGDGEHVTRLYNFLNTKRFQEQQEFSSSVNSENSPTLIDEMFGYYIMPFHKDYNDSSSCHTPVNVPSNPSSKSNSAEDLTCGPGEKEPTHSRFRTALRKRDGVCLFCWEPEEVEAAHLIAQKNVNFAYEERPILQRAGLSHKHLVQNGMWLCRICHSRFHKLKRYVDVVDDKVVLKVVNETNDPSSDKHRKWTEVVGDLQLLRHNRQGRWTDNRQAVEANGEMAIYFLPGNATELLPNRAALQFHKAACLIWKMAGGAECDEEYCPDDDDGDYIPVGYGSKNLQRWRDSSATLIAGNTVDNGLDVPLAS